MKKLVFILLLCCIVVVILGIKHSNNQMKAQALISQESKKNDEKLAEDKKKQEEATYSELYKRLLSGKVTRIKLIGDSITAGIGIPSHSTPADGRIIFNNGQGEVYREASLFTKAWANYFREYVQSNFKPLNVDFINNGIGGKSAKWVNQNKTYLVDKEDVAFVMLGTNDRFEGTIEDYKNNLKTVLDYVSKHSNLMYVMSPPPSRNDVDYAFGAKEINDAVKEICLQNKYNFISFYENFVDYAKVNNIGLGDLQEKAGSHPSQLGYDEMWTFLSKELTLKKQY